jgi:hypothetical protein
MFRLLTGLVVLLCLAGTANAERCTFVIANDADGYGIDRCLASGAKCGAAVANAYCKTQAFAEAATFHKAESTDITNAVASDATNLCHGGNCGVVAIVCTR